MATEVGWLEHLTDSQWAEIRAIARDLYDAEYFEKNQFKVTVLAFLIWCQETETENLTEMPNALQH